ncbi:aromatic prenyltransferase [Streptomyces sp. NBC_01298]|uniref:aromatic prenyltransferase n=1 Tax=Streptomyces sp. NBC_01298 TaxID=2903817 RepID=UPI002E0DE389|nr:aromatic prenyltransferase [Streptomyces sp. NBC_01298]
MPESCQFSPDRFLTDMEATARAIGAGYCPSTTRRMLDVYESGFHEGAVLWRTTSKPAGALNYRFYARRPTDTVAIATSAGLLAPADPMARLIGAWSGLYEGSTELCDFDAVDGLVKTWVFLGGMRPMADVLATPGVPQGIRRHEAAFDKLGLTWVRHVAVDYQNQSVNLYFRTIEGFTPAQAERLLALTGAELPEAAVLKDMEGFTAPTGCTFSVTMSAATGRIERVGVYALRLPTGQFPTIGERLEQFFTTAPSHDDEEMNAVAWSFGAQGRQYIKAERSYCGRLVELMRQWASPMTDTGARA